MSYVQLNYAFLFVLKHFWWISLKYSLFRQKSDYLSEKLRNTQKFVFLNKFEKE